MEMIPLLEKLTQACGVAGDEGPIADLLEQEIKDIGPVRRTPLGSLICTVKQESPEKPHVVLEAHIDEIGLMVCAIDEEGFLKVTRCGGIDRRVATASPVLIHGRKGARRGILCSEQSDPNKNPTLEQLFVDAGMSKEQAGEEFPIGTRISYIGSLKHLLEGKVSSKALDDRCGCAVLMETMRRLGKTDNEIVAVFTTQEEVGLRGATTAGYAADPDMAIALDVTHANDFPRAKETTHVVSRLGKGAAVKIMDRGLIAHPDVVEALEAAAAKAGVPCQREILLGGSTDAAAIHKSRAGVPSGVISLPCRYVHAPCEMVDLNDLEGAVRILLALL